MTMKSETQIDCPTEPQRPAAQSVAVRRISPNRCNEKDKCTMPLSRLKPLLLPVVLLMWTVACYVARLPSHVQFADFAFGDPGAVLSVDVLVAEGLQPGVDFSYLYGLLPLGVGRLWFAMLGTTPAAYIGLHALLNLTTVAGLTTVWARTGRSLAGLLVLFATIPFGIAANGVSLTHAAEPAVLVWALAALASRRPGVSLALVTIGTTVKPGESYLFGVIILVVLAAGAWGGWRAALRHLVPAVAIGAVLLTGFAVVFGVRPAIAAQFPQAASGVYRAEGFGFFFGTGRDFWWSPGVRPTYYIGTAAGFWILATLLLGIAASIRLRAAVRDPSSPAIVVVAAGLTHLTYVLIGFGPPTAWAYDFPLVVAGVVAELGGLARFGGWAVRGLRSVAVSFAVLANYATVMGEIQTQQHLERRLETYDLYAPPELAKEWEMVREAGRKRSVFVLYYHGGLLALSDEVSAPRSWCYYWWQAPWVEEEAVLASIIRAEEVHIPKYLDSYLAPTHPANAPAVKAALAKFPHRFETKYFVVYYR
jgi:hypothetical protein